MNKYLMLSAAAVLAGTAGASAGTYCFKFGSAAGSAYCDDAIVYTGVDGGALSGAVWAWSVGHCSGTTSEGQGLVAKTAGLGKIADMSDNFYAEYYGIYSEQLNYTLPKRLRNGKPWTLWVGPTEQPRSRAGAACSPVSRSARIAPRPTARDPCFQV